MTDGWEKQARRRLITKHLIPREFCGFEIRASMILASCRQPLPRDGAPGLIRRIDEFPRANRPWEIAVLIIAF